MINKVTSEFVYQKNCCSRLIFFWFFVVFFFFFFFFISFVVCELFLDLVNWPFSKSKPKYMRLKQINDLTHTSLWFMCKREREKEQEKVADCNLLKGYILCVCVRFFFFLSFIHRKQLFLWQYINVINEFYE